MASRRREWGSGSLYQRASDGRWVGSIDAGTTANGTRRRITVSAKSQALAKRKLRDKIADLEREGPTDVSSRTTVKAWASDWLAMKELRLRPASYVAVRSHVVQWIVPTIGHHRLDELQPAHARAIAARLRHPPDGTPARSTTTARNVHRTLLSMLKDAKIEGHRVAERMLLLEAPSQAVSDRQPMTDLEALTVLAVAAGLDHGARWAVALLYGLRQAECLGLTWESVDLDSPTGPTLAVEWQLQPLPYVSRRDRTSGFRVPDGYEARHLIDAYHLTRPKSRKGFRVLPLVPGVATALRQWREIAPETPHGLIWPAADGRPARAADDLEEWHALQGTAGVGHPVGRYYHLHEARHGLATALKEAGVDDATTTAIMGHSTILTSRGYMYQRQEAALEALQKVAARFELT